MPDYAIASVRHLVGKESGQAEQQVPEHGRDDAIAEIFRQAFDGGPGYAMRVKPHRIAADNVLHRCAARTEPSSIERLGNGGDMLVQAALGDEDGNQQGFNHGPEQVATAKSLNHEPQRCRTADQQYHRYDATVAARDLAANLAVQFTVEKSDRAAGKHNRMGDMAKDRRHV